MCTLASMTGDRVPSGCSITTAVLPRPPAVLRNLLAAPTNFSAQWAAHHQCKAEFVSCKNKVLYDLSGPDNTSPLNDGQPQGQRWLISGSLTRISPSHDENGILAKKSIGLRRQTRCSWSSTPTKSCGKTPYETPWPNNVRLRWCEAWQSRTLIPLRCGRPTWTPAGPR